MHRYANLPVPKINMNPTPEEKARSIAEFEKRELSDKEEMAFEKELADDIRNNRVAGYIDKKDIPHMLR